MNNGRIKERRLGCFKRSGCAVPELTMTVEFRRCTMRGLRIHVNKHMSCTIFL